MSEELISRLQESYPFMAICKYADTEYVGIIQNKDDSVTTIYDYSAIPTQELKLQFIELAEQWWYGSNRTVPIHLFLKNEWAPFKPYLRTFITKNVVFLHGPVVSLTALLKKKSKRKTIIISRRMG